MSSLIDSDVQKIAALSLCSGASFYFLYQMYFNRNDNVGPIKSEDGVLNYRKLNFMPDSLNEIRYEQPKSAFGKMLTEAWHGLMGYMFLPKYSIDFLNARKADIDYQKNGFTLVKNPIEECDWLQKENREKFYKAMEKTIRELHPDAETVYWIDEAFLARNTTGGNPPAVDGPHVDYHVDQSVVKEFAGYDMSDFDIVVGLWKPANMTTPVVDYPLAVMDASTFHKDQVIPLFGSIRQTTIKQESQDIKFVSGSLKYSAQQRWYYYPNQTSEEVLVFRHYTNEKNGEPFACPHTSFTEPNFPREAPSRQSVETRVGIILKK